MNRVIAATAIIAFGLVPAVGSACEYADDSWASATPKEQVGTAPAEAPVPAAAVTKDTKATVTKWSTPQAAKPVAVKTKTTTPDRVATNTTSN